MAMVTQNAYDLSRSPYGDHGLKLELYQKLTDASYPEVDKLLLLSVKLDMSLDEMFADELAYLKRGNGKESSQWDKIPGAIAGLKTFAERLKTLNL